MQRDIQGLASQIFDVLIVGAGIHGAWTAFRAAQAGYRVALIERNDFGAATSANSLRILHGGLRYLQNLDLPRMRRSIRARREFARLTPHLVRPLPCTIELGGTGVRSPWFMGPALLVNDLVSWDRNVGLVGSVSLPQGRLISSSDCRRALAGLLTSDSFAGAVWWDALALDPGRLVLEPIMAAERLGAVVANHVGAERYVIRNGVVCGVVASDGLTGRSFDIQAKVTVNTTGPWCDQLSLASGLPAAYAPGQWVGALNVVLRRDFGIESAIGLSSRSRAGDESTVLRRATRDVFFVPARGVTMVGTDYHAVAWPDPSARSPPTGAVASFVAELNVVAPQAELSDADVAGVHWGILPRADGQSELPRKSPVVRHGAQAGARGLIISIGEKFTSAPELARQLVKRIADIVGAGGRTPPHHNAAGDPRENEPDTPAAERLRDRYGPSWRAVAGGANEDASRPVHEGCDALQAEVEHAIRREMACTLEDILVRRLGLDQHGHPGQRVIEAVAGLAAHELGWDATQKAQAIAQLDASYRGMRQH